MNDPRTSGRTIGLHYLNDNGSVRGQRGGMAMIKKNGSPTPIFKDAPAFGLLDSFLHKHGRLPDPTQASTLSLLTGKRVRASDGRLYPRGSKHERAASKKAALDKKEYHRIAREVARLRQALACLGQIAAPTDLAIHMKDDADLGFKLDHALGWLRRFAEELHNCDEACR